MLLEISIRDKLYEDILSFCEVNSVKLEDCLNEWIENSFYTEKYGDINLLFKEKDEEHVKLNKAEEKKEIQNNENSYVDEKKNEVCETIVVEKEEVPLKEEIKKEENIETKRIKRTRRTIKAK